MNKRKGFVKAIHIIAHEQRELCVMLFATMNYVNTVNQHDLNAIFKQGERYGYGYHFRIETLEFILHDNYAIMARGIRGKAPWDSDLCI